VAAREGSAKAESSALRLLWRRGGVDPRDVWRVLELEAHLAFKAWSSAPRAQRRRARRAYRDALAREACAAALLEELARDGAVGAER
jgi:acyl-CoA reductase-like NAD-dependent aldehyde dehydrogenase